MLVSQVPANVEFQAWFRPGFLMGVERLKDGTLAYNFAKRSHTFRQHRAFHVATGKIIANHPDRHVFDVVIQPAGSYFGPTHSYAGNAEMPYLVLKQLRILSAESQYAPTYRPRSWKYLQDGINYRTSERVTLSW